MSRQAERAWDANAYDHRHSYVWKHGAGVVELLAPQAGERILDLGCGTGHLTARIAKSGADVIGIDSSPDMIEQARRNYPTIAFEVADATDFAFEQPLDAVFSSAVLHWIADKDAVARRARAALKPGGRFVVEFGGKGNIRLIQNAVVRTLEESGHADAAARSPWHYSSIAEFTSVLEKNGLEPTFAVLFDRPTPLDGGESGLHNWLRMFAGDYFADLSDEATEALYAGIEDRLRPTLYRDGGWMADYRRLRAVAIKPTET